MIINDTGPCQNQKVIELFQLLLFVHLHVNTTACLTDSVWRYQRGNQKP